MQVMLGIALRKPEKLDGVGVLEDALGLQIHFLHHRCEFCGRERGLELTLQLPIGPPLPNGHPQMELALFRAFALPEDDEVVAPRQLMRQRRTNWLVTVSFVELLHSE